MSYFKTTTNFILISQLSKATNNHKTHNYPFHNSQSIISTIYNGCGINCGPKFLFSWSLSTTSLERIAFFSGNYSIYMKKKKKKKKNLDRNFISLLPVISLKRSLIIQVNCFLLDWIFKKHSSSLFHFPNGITTYITMCKYIYTHYSLLSGLPHFCLLNLVFLTILLNELLVKCHINSKRRSKLVAYYSSQSI